MDSLCRDRHTHGELQLRTGLVVGDADHRCRIASSAHRGPVIVLSGNAETRRLSGALADPIGSIDSYLPLSTLRSPFTVLHGILRPQRRSRAGERSNRPSLGRWPGFDPLGADNERDLPE